jgi:hypothetical protein
MMKIKVRMLKTLMWHQKERCESEEIEIDLSKIPEIAAKEKEGFKAQSVWGLKP